LFDSTTVFRVTSVANPGAATSGTVRQATPGTYFNGTWTIASNPTTDSIRVTDATIATGADAGSGDLEGSLSATGAFAGELFDNNNGHYQNGITSPESPSRLGIGFYTTSTPTHVGLGVNAPPSNLSGWQDKAITSSATEHTHGFEATFAVDQGNSDEIKGFYLGSSQAATCFVVIFDQQQRKDSGYTLQMGYKWTIRPELSQ
jgi:hypothetical protein